MNDNILQIENLSKYFGGLAAVSNCSLKVKKGSKVKAGDTLVILEAMKMEHSIRASEDGVITELFVSGNDQVENGALLMVLDSD